MTPDRGPLESIRAFMWTLLLSAVVLSWAVWIVSEIWAWLLGIAAVLALIVGLVVWLRWLRDRLG